MPTLDALLLRYWNVHEVSINLVVFANILGALLLGLIAGYERTYHGRAAGMRTYGLVCMASCALTVLAGYPLHWFGGQHVSAFTTHLPPDPTRIIQGIVTGIGFLGAGMIMKDGLSITGLTSAASLWSSSAIGILVGVGFYAAAILLTVLSASLMMYAARLERILPARPAISLTLTYKPGVEPSRQALDHIARERGYQVASGSFSVRYFEGRHVWRFVCIEVDRRRALPITGLSGDLAQLEGIEAFEIGHARN
ncbi:putative Mg2+ transporter-C (MgtC) family protein [Inhella inkyongensis]|uniref:Protein MgtC n=1 Tax=Inhella inkyongensis TaxID=392593 RepID=A0A840S640_9BURK|nr:MgtC/SapB family protein [Inhella inkyongensis]MBB5205163.1 putative Mg2+ transporter-C (MgtC) family protein [Inhella inkyongensis]